MCISFIAFFDDDERSTVSSVCVCAKMIEFCVKKEKRMDPNWIQNGL